MRLLQLLVLLLPSCSHGRACATELDTEWCLVVAETIPIVAYELDKATEVRDG